MQERKRLTRKNKHNGWSIMKAIVYDQYGPPDVLRLEEVEIPVPENNEALVRVRAASINYADWQVLRGESFLLRVMNGVFKPRKNILGDDISGIVEAVGEAARRLQPGDEVFGISNFDAFAEFACVPENELAVKPGGITFEQAAAIPEAGLTALQGVRDNGRLKSGQKVLIYGASGGVGTFAVQIAKSIGADVTGVCSTKKMEFVRSLGADHVIDYTKEDFTRNGLHYDLIFAAGGHRSIFDYQRALSPEGTYVCAGGSASQYFQALLLGPLISMLGSKKIGSMYANLNTDDYLFLAALIESGKLAHFIDRTYTLSEVPAALRYYGEGKAQGKIVITMDHN
jgi:NADPH:quinone reductase-like Zn-dependent oxidoreductase